MIKSFLLMYLCDKTSQKNFRKKSIDKHTHKQKRKEKEKKKLVRKISFFLYISCVKLLIFFLLYQANIYAF